MKLIEVNARFEFKVPDEVNPENVELLVVPCGAKLVVNNEDVSTCHEYVEQGETEVLENDTDR